MLHFVVFFITITILIIFLATKQRKPLDRFCLTAIALLCLLTITSIVLLHGTNLFPASAFALAALLLAHRSIVHFPPDLDAATADHSNTVCDTASHSNNTCTATVRETANHGTWIAVALVAGLVSVFGI